MKKWEVTLSTTEPFNYIGIVKVRQGNVNSEVLRASIIENGQVLDLTGYKATIQTVIGNYPVERACTIADPKKGIVEYVFDAYTMQTPGRQRATIVFYKGDSLVGSTQDFSYFVVQAVSKTDAETGSYWQSVDDLIKDMTDYINAGQGDFDQWFDSVKDILASIDPGGKLLLEVVNARIDLSGVTHPSLSDRLRTDLIYIRDYLLSKNYVLWSGDVNGYSILQDDKFSQNHTLQLIGQVIASEKNGALIIATIDDTKQGIFELQIAGEVDG